MSTQTIQTEKSDIASAVEQAFVGANADVGKAKSNNGKALDTLEKGLLEISKQVAANSKSCLEIYRYGDIETSNGMHSDGSYHMTQTYVLAFSKHEGWGYDHIVFVRHSGGHLNDVSCRNKTTTGKLGRSYQSVSVFDYVDYEPHRSGFRFGYPKLKNVLKGLAGDKVKAGDYASFDGSLDNPEEVVRTVAVTLGKYYRGLTQPSANTRIRISGDKLEDAVDAVMAEHSGILAGCNDICFFPKLIPVKPPVIAPVVNSIRKRLFGL